MRIFSFIKKPLFITTSILLLFYVLSVNLGREPVENLDIPVGIGYDLKKDGTLNTYKVIYTIYNFSEKGVSSSTRIGYGNTIGLARQDKQTKSNKKFIFGLEKVYALSDQYACSGINSMVDILLSTPEVTDIGEVVVCRDPESLLNYKTIGYPSSADYIKDMIENASNYNFFAKKYRLIDLYLNLGGEGRNACIPYIDITDESLKITGMALFKGPKMVAKLDMNETKVMNLLRENNSTGILSLQTSSKNYIDFDGKSSRKVTCKKINGKYTFTIDLTIKGYIISNQLYNDLPESKNTRILFEKELSKEVEKMCNSFLESMKSQYKVDCLNLGIVACAKYGRNTGIDWNEVVSNSDINVNVNIKLDKLGRGDY